MFPETKSRETSGLEEKKKLTGFPRDLTLSASRAIIGLLLLLVQFVIFLDKRITGANQNSRLGTLI